MAKILMIAGSLRRESLNRQLAEEIAQLVGDRAEVAFLDFADVPFLNQDIEFPTPDAVQKARDAVQAADGIWICSPEYNFNVPGVLKNLLDWLSRPLKENDWSAGSAVKGKPVTISGAAGKSGAAGVRSALQGLLEAMRMEVIGEAGTGIVLSKDAFSTGKLTLSEEDRAALRAQAEVFLRRLTR